MYSCSVPIVPDGWNNFAYINNGVTDAIDWLGACREVPYIIMIDDPNNPGQQIPFNTGNYYTVPCSPGEESIIGYEYTEWVHVGDILTMECGNTSNGSLSGASASINWSGTITIGVVTITGEYSGTSSTAGYSNISPYSCTLEHGEIHSSSGFAEYQLKYRLKIEAVKTTYKCGEAVYSLKYTPAWSYGLINTVPCKPE